jgi:hypothetical protein
MYGVRPKYPTCASQDRVVSKERCSWPPSFVNHFAMSSSASFRWPHQTSFSGVPSRCNGEPASHSSTVVVIFLVTTVVTMAVS